jgi:site-specific recombinase XerD
MVLNLIRGMAEKDNIPLAHTLAPGLQTPQEGIPLWLANLKADQYSPMTIEQYHLVVRNYLKYDPHPTFFSIQRYLADRLDIVSPARVAMERKALRSFFKFLHSAGLWQTDPTANIKSIKVPYRERELPSKEDVAKLLRAKCYRNKDTQKFRLMVILLLDTGLRITEACSIRKANINFECLEIKVMGKGGKERVVPISPITTNLLKAWVGQNDKSEWLFPAAHIWGYWDKVGVEKMMRRACERYGIKPMTPHALRHFFATHNLKNGARLEVISRILGHASTAITADIYVHVDSEDIHSTHRQFSPLTKLMLSPAETA